MTITINPDLQSLIPPLTPEEYVQLEANLLADGCRDPLIVWQEEQTVLDGHNRYAICTRHSLDYRLHEVSLPDMDAAKAWMIANQLGRRNLTPDQMSYFRGKQYEMQKRQGKRTDLTSGKTYQKSQNTATQLAQQHKVSEKTIRNDAVYAKAIDTLADVAGPEARQALLSRETKVTQHEVKALAKIATQHAHTAKEALDTVQEAKTPKQARQIVRQKAREARDYDEWMASMIRSNVPEDELPACYRAKRTPAPADGLAPRFRQTLRSLEVLHTCLQMVSLPDALEPHREACLALGKAYRQIEQLMAQHTAIRQGLAAPPSALPPPLALAEAPPPPHEPAPLLLAGGQPIPERDYCIVHVPYSPGQTARDERLWGLEHCQLQQCSQEPHYFFWTHDPRATGRVLVHRFELCPAHAEQWCTAHQVDLGAIPTIAVSDWAAHDWDQVPWFRLSEPGAPAQPLPQTVPQGRPSDYGQRTQAVEAMARKLQRFTCPEIAKKLGDDRRAVKLVLTRKVKQGKVRKEGQTYAWVDAANEVAV